MHPFLYNVGKDALQTYLYLYWIWNYYMLASTELIFRVQKFWSLIILFILQILFSCFHYFLLSSKVLRPQTFLNLAFANRKLTLVQTTLLFLSPFVNSFSFSPHVVDVTERHALIFKMPSCENSHLQVVHFYNSWPKCDCHAGKSNMQNADLTCFALYP